MLGTSRAASLILASASPRRLELLGCLGLDFKVVPSTGVDEKVFLARQTGTPEQRLKALAQAKGVEVSAANPGALVLSADTEVILDREFLGKPADREHAEAMLARLSGRRHMVCTAISLQRLQPVLALSAAVKTAVTFAKLTQEQICHYVTAAQPFDYAGGYAMQGLGALLITRITGDASSVIGLPLGATIELLAQAGIHVFGSHVTPA